MGMCGDAWKRMFKKNDDQLAKTVEGTRDDEENDEWFYLENVCLVISSGWYYSSSTNN